MKGAKQAMEKLRKKMIELIERNKERERAEGLDERMKYYHKGKVDAYELVLEEVNLRELT